MICSLKPSGILSAALLLVCVCGVTPLWGQDVAVHAPLQGLPRTFRWGVQSPDLVRYNRVEGASLGARLQIRPQSPLGPVTVSLEARLGSADLEPNVRLDVSRETLSRRVTLSVYRELAAVDGGAGHLRFANSMTALLFGRDEGEYYRRSGAQLEWKPPTSQRAVFRLNGFAEYHEAAETGTGFDLRHVRDDAWLFRDNVVADEGWEVGSQLSLSPWWGTDRRAAQGGIDATVRAATGDFEYVRASLGGRVSVPLPADFKVGVEAGGGTSWGAPSAQRHWMLGGAGSLRGYAPRSREGTSYVLARAELARTQAFGAVSAFSELGWAGERDLFDMDDALVSIGLGLSIADGLIRVDGGWGLRAPEGFRLDLYLDAIL